MKNSKLNLKTAQTKAKIIAFWLVLMVTSNVSQAGEFEENFEDIGFLNDNGWVFDNRSDFVGDGFWFQGNPVVGSAQAGTANSYIIGNRGQSAGNILCDWLILPDIGFVEQLNFYTRTEVNSARADRLVVVYSASGSINTGTCVTSDPKAMQKGGLTGDFGDFEVLMAVNPNLIDGVYPEDWTEFNVPVNGDGRLALVYFVDNLSQAPFNGNLIAIDSINIGAGTPPMQPPLAAVSVPSLGLWSLIILMVIMLLTVIIYKGKDTLRISL
jgi:hypothetical protein